MVKKAVNEFLGDSWKVTMVSNTKLKVQVLSKTITGKLLTEIGFFPVG